MTHCVGLDMSQKPAAISIVTIAVACCGVVSARWTLNRLSAWCVGMPKRVASLDARLRERRSRY